MLKLRKPLAGPPDIKAIKKALPDLLKDREILAIYVDFEGELPGEGVSRSKYTGVVATHLAAWFEGDKDATDTIAEMLDE